MDSTNKTSIKDFFDYAPLRDRIPVKVRVKILTKLNESIEPHPFDDTNLNGINYSNNSKSLYSIDEPLISEVIL